MVSYPGWHHCMDTRIRRGTEGGSRCVLRGLRASRDILAAFTILEEKGSLYKKEPRFCCSKLDFAVLGIIFLYRASSGAVGLEMTSCSWI